jgi:hypothetical protein
MIERKLTDREVIGYLSSVIVLLGDALESKASLDSYAVANGPTFRQMVEQSRSVARTNVVRVG